MNRFDQTADNIKKSQAIEKLSSLKDGTLVPIPIQMIARDQNIRKKTEGEPDSDFMQLKESIREVGLLQNPIVMVSGEQVICVAGHRRISACENLGYERIPCLLRKFESMELKDVAQLLENTARKDLHPLDIAKQLHRLKLEGYNQIKLQDLMGKDRKTIGRFQKMATWPEEAHEIIRKHTERLKTGVLLQLASRTISDQELITQLKHKAGLIREEIDEKRKVLAKKLVSKVSGYFDSRGYGSKESAIIVEALETLGFVRKGILDPLKSDQNLDTSSLETEVIRPKVAQKTVIPKEITPAQRQKNQAKAPMSTPETLKNTKSSPKHVAKDESELERAVLNASKSRVGKPTNKKKVAKKAKAPVKKASKKTKATKKKPTKKH